MLDSRLTLLYLGHYLKINAPVAQLDRVSASEAEGHRFESCRVRHFPKFVSSNQALVTNDSSETSDGALKGALFVF